MIKILQYLRRRTIDLFHRTNSYRGVYQSFAEASQAAPTTKPIGYDQPETATWWKDRLEKIESDDYPALFWIGRALQDSRSVFEVGGHVGIAYYGFSRYLDYPAGFHWEICDVPAIAQEGRRLAAERGHTNLTFVSSPAESPGADIFFASGSLQYIESPTLADMINGFTRKPKHIIVTKTPMWDGARFVTLQNIGCSYCPYVINNKGEFIASIEAHGYKLVDSWKKPRSFSVAGRQGMDFDHFSGYYFALRNT